MAFEILVDELAATELGSLRVFHQRQIVAAIEEQLSHQPDVPTRRRKCLQTLVPSFEHIPPVWELRVGDYRVFYDVDADANIVHVRAVRRKTPEERTKGIT